MVASLVINSQFHLIALREPFNLNGPYEMSLTMLTYYASCEKWQNVRNVEVYNISQVGSLEDNGSVHAHR